MGNISRCRRKGHDWDGRGPDVPLQVGETQTCAWCECKRERRVGGLITYYAPPELTRSPLGEVK